MKEINKGKESEKVINSDSNECSFAKHISQLREKRKLTQKALADKIQVSDRTISKWENGLTVPDLINVRNICKVLGVSANSIVLNKRTIKDYFKDLGHLLVIFWKHIYNNIFKVVFAIIFILLLIYFISNYNAVNVYILNYDSKDIVIGKGYFIKTKVDKILMIDNIELNTDYNPEEDILKLELYLMMNGDRVVIYEDNKLEDIFIEELTRYPETFTNDVTKEITNGLYLAVTVNEDEYYECKINFRKNFSSNKIVYSSSYLETISGTDYKNYLGFESSSKYLNNFNRGYSNNLENTKISIASNMVVDEFAVDDNKLKSLDYVYDADADMYTKYDGDKEIIYKPEFDLLITKIVTSDGLETNAYYYIENDRIDFEIIDDSGKSDCRFKYFVEEDKIDCVIGNCENYRDEIDYILNEYQKISELL